MGMKVKVEGSNPKPIMKELKDFVGKESLDLIDEIYAGVKQDHPHDTGYSSSRWTKDENGIYNDADYTIYLEEGHSDQAPHGFINRNIKQALNKRS